MQYWTVAERSCEKVHVGVVNFANTGVACLTNQQETVHDPRL